MDNNLPPNDDNQQPNINPPEPSVIPPAEEENKNPVPPMPEIPETPPAKPEENLPQSEPTPEEAKTTIEEKPIEIGSLEETSFTSYSQENTEKGQDDSQNQAKTKSKKVKTITSVLALLLIIASLPISMILVKQRQEIRKEAAGVVSSGSANVCGVILSASHSYNSSGKLTTTFTIKNTRSDTATFEFHTYSCVCSGGNQRPCGTNSGKCDPTNNRITLKPGEETKKTVSATQSNGDCGSFQNDGFILNVNGKSNCSNN